MANSMYVFPLLMLPPHIISCVATLFCLLSLSLELSPYTVLLVPYIFEVLLFFPCFVVYMFDRVLLFKIPTPFWGSPYQHHHLFVDKYMP